MTATAAARPMPDHYLTSITRKAGLAEQPPQELELPRERWRTGDPHPLPFTEGAVDAAAVGDLRLLPG